MAAVKACGEGALLRRQAAAYHWALIKKPPPEPEVLTLTERRVKGVRTRRARAGIDRRDKRTWRGIPVTSIPRTIVDLAADTPEDQLARIFHEAAVKYRTKPEQVEEVLARRPNSPGAKRLRAAMYGDQALKLSKLEAAFIELLRAAGLPLPKTNKRRDGHLIDCRWPDRKLTIELDSYTYHATKYAWKQDRRRDREAYDRGDRLRRFIYDEVFDEPEYVLAEMRQLLSTPPS